MTFEDACSEQQYRILIEQGYRPLILDGKTKSISAPNWPKLAGTQPWRAGCNFGILCRPGEVNLIDVDVDDDAIAARILQEFWSPNLAYRVGRAPRFGIPCVIDDVEQRDYKFGPHKVQILSDNKQFVAFGEHPDTHALYEWPLAPLPARADLPRFKLQVVLLRLERAFGQFGLVRKDVLDGVKHLHKPVLDESERQVVETWARNHGLNEARVIAAMPPGTGRGERSVTLGSAISLGITDELETAIVSMLSGLPHDNNNCPREFRNGLAMPIDATLNVGWQKVLQHRALGETLAVMQPPEPPPGTEAPVDFDAQYGFMTIERPELAWRVPGMIQEIGTGFIFGKEFRGKSVVLHDLVAAMAIGGQWAGAEVKKLEPHERALVVSFEGENHFRTRLMAAFRKRGVDPAKFPEIASRVWGVFPQPGETALAEVVGLIAKAMGAGKHVRFVAVDTWSAGRLVKGDNDTDEVRDMLSRANVNAKAGGYMMAFVDHVAKGQHDNDESAKGSANKMGDADFQLFVSDGRLDFKKVKGARKPDLVSFSIAGAEGLDAPVIEWPASEDAQVTSIIPGYQELIRMASLALVSTPRGPLESLSEGTVTEYQLFEHRMRLSDSFGEEQLERATFVMSAEGFRALVRAVAGERATDRYVRARIQSMEGAGFVKFSSGAKRLPYALLMGTAWRAPTASP